MGVPETTSPRRGAARLDRLPRRWLAYYGAWAAWLGTTAMHIPDGYLSPSTCATLYVLSGSGWWVALKKIKRVLMTRTEDVFVSLVERARAPPAGP